MLNIDCELQKTVGETLPRNQSQAVKLEEKELRNAIDIVISANPGERYALILSVKQSGDGWLVRRSELFLEDKDDPVLRLPGLRRQRGINASYRTINALLAQWRRVTRHRGNVLFSLMLD